MNNMIVQKEDIEENSPILLTWEQSPCSLSNAPLPGSGDFGNLILRVLETLEA